MRMMKRTRMNESHPHKTVICRMCVTRKSGKEKEKGSWSNSGADLPSGLRLRLRHNQLGPSTGRTMVFPAVRLTVWTVGRAWL